MADFDLAIIGGGINGAGIARDAAGRGLCVLLVEQNDLASGTSSTSTKLIHGGLRYLEFYAFRLVREALIEREVLLRMAPHLDPAAALRAAAPCGPAAGLDAAARPVPLRPSRRTRRSCPAPRMVDLTHHVVGEPLKAPYRRGFRYSDCWVDDARLVVLNAVDAAERGAVIRTRTKLVRADRDGGSGSSCSTRAEGARSSRRACWSTPPARGSPTSPSTCCGCRPRRMCAWSRAATSWCAACSITTTPTFSRTPTAASSSPFPYERDFTLIGTTDEDFKGDPAAPAATADEITYLCRAASVYFRDPVTPDEVVWPIRGRAAAL